jgi:hypothetical protein
MALRTCNECGNQVSASAKSCPQCGAKGKALVGSREKGIFGKALLAFFGLSIVITAATEVMNPSTPETAEEEAYRARVQERNVNIVTYARSLKAAMRNPHSVSFDRVLTNGDGSLVCFSYRAENGFGGINRERVAFSPAGGSQERRVVKTICSDKDMKDVTRLVQPLIASFG